MREHGETPALPRLRREQALPTRFGHAPELLHEAVIAELERLEGVVLTDLLSLYFDEAAGHMSQLRGAVGRGETVAVGQTAHKLVGSSGTLGAAHVAHVASELKATAMAGDLTVADELLDRLRSGLDETRKAYCNRVAEPQMTPATDRGNLAAQGRLLR